MEKNRAFSDKFSTKNRAAGLPEIKRLLLRREHKRMHKLFVKYFHEHWPRCQYQLEYKINYKQWILKL